MKDCSSSTACLMQGFSSVADESNSSSVWNSAILFCTSSLRRLRPRIRFSCGDEGIRFLVQKKRRYVRTKKKTMHQIEKHNVQTVGSFFTWHPHSKVSTGRNLSQKHLDPRFLRLEQQHAHKCPLEFTNCQNFRSE